MHPADISSKLKKAGATASSIARELGISQASVSRVISALSRSQRVEEMISASTDIPLYELWPQWYDAPKGQSRAPVGAAAVDPVVLSFVLYAIEDELVARIKGLEKPYEVALLHVGRVYNNLSVRTQDSPGFHDGLKATVRDYIETFDFEGGPDLANTFLRKPKVTEPRAKAAVVNQNSTIGKQVNLTGDNVELVLGSKIKKQVVNRAK